MGTGNPKILAFFGSDLAFRNGARLLRKAHGNGFNLLALDSRAMACATRAGLPYTTLEDWLDSADIAAAVDRSLLCLDNWFEPAREELTAEGICWPEIDKSAMKWFWQDAMLSLQIAQKLRDRECTTFAFFRNLFSRAAVGHPRSDTCNVLWEAELSEIRQQRFLLLDQFASDRTLKWLKGGIGRLGAIFTPPSLAQQAVEIREIPQRSVVLVIGPGEEVRFNQYVDGLSHRLPGKMAVAIAGQYSQTSAAIVSHWEVPVVYGPRWPAYRVMAALPSFLLPRPDRELGERFLDGYQHALKAAAGTLWQKALEHLGFHFRYYCLYRWPYLLKECLRFWVDLWERIRPKAILVTSRDEAVFALASAAAGQMGIRSFCAPHGGNSGIKRDCTPLLNDWVLCNSPLQRARFALRGFPPDRIAVCKGLLAPNEYEVSSTVALAHKSRYRILVLTEATGEGTNLVKYTSPRAQMRALRIVAHPPPDMVVPIDIAIKVHPHISDLEILEAAGSEVAEHLMPLSSDLLTALESADLVVGINYRGTALIHAMRAGKPIIQLLTESPLLWDRPDFPFGILEDGTTVVTTGEEFWDLVRSYFTTPQVAEGMRRKSGAFFHEHLDDSSFPPWWDVVEDKLRTTREKE